MEETKSRRDGQERKTDKRQKRKRKERDMNEHPFKTDKKTDRQN